MGTPIEMYSDFSCRKLLILMASNKINLQSQLGASPVTAFGVPFDGIISSHSDPMWQRPILSLFLCECSLGAKGFLGRLQLK